MNNTKWHKGLLKKLTQRAKTPLFVFLGGAILGVGALLIMSGNLTLPMITISPTQVAGGLNSFFALEDDAIRFGENTIRISRHRLDMGNKRITNLATPIAASDAATRGYVDAAAGSGVCYTAWGHITCPAGWVAVYAGVMAFGHVTHGTTTSSVGPWCSSRSHAILHEPSFRVALQTLHSWARWGGEEPCAVCCR